MPWGLLLPRCSSHVWNGVLAKISIATVALSAPKSTLRLTAPVMSCAGRTAKMLLYEKCQVFQGWSCLGQNEFWPFKKNVSIWKYSVRVCAC